MNEEYEVYSPEDGYSDGENCDEEVQVQDDCKTPDQMRLFLKKKLREIQNQIGSAESEIERHQREAEGLKNEKTSLDAEFAAIDQVLTDFEAKEDDVNCELEKVENYVKKSQKQFHDAIRKPMRKAIRAIQDGVDAGIKSVEDRNEYLDGKENVSPEDGTGHATILQAANFLHNCKLVQDEKQEAYDEIKNQLSAIEAELAAMGEIIVQIEAQIEAGEMRNAYVYYRDLEKKVRNARDKFETFKDGPPSEAICNAWNELDEINKLVRQAEQNLNDRQNELAAGKTLLEALEQNRINDIFDQIKAGDPGNSN